MSISVVQEGIFMMHEGGTKFYEVVQLHVADLGQHLVIKRWGKTSGIHGGGEIQAQMHSNARRAQGLADTIIRGKEVRGYQKRSVALGLHGYGGVIDSSNVRQLLETHYGIHNTNYILHQFRDALGSGTAITGQLVIDEADSIISEEPALEPERGESWGSW